MKMKYLAAIGMAICILSNVAFGQTVQITGKVTAFDQSNITMQSGSINWTINRTSTTSVTNGSLSVGSTITVKCIPSDAHKNESAGLGGG